MNSVLSYTFKLFLQGIEIPFVSADVQFSTRSHFNIEIPPVNEVNDIKPGTHAILAFKRRGSDEDWHLLCEGFYTGPYYSKQASSRSLRLRFRDVQWFAENATIYSIMDDISSADTFALTARSFYGDASMGSPDKDGKVRLASVNFTARFGFLSALQGDNPLDTMTQTIFGWLTSGNDFTKVHTNGWHVDGGRVHSVENKEMNRIYTLDMIESSFRDVLSNSNNLTNVLDILLMLMQKVHYDIMPIPCMAEGLKSYVSKPHLPLAVPPACNVIFPDETINFGFNVDYSIRPTRLWFRGVIHNHAARGYIAPKELEDLEDPRKVTDEERFQGIRGQESRLPFAYTTTSPEEGRKSDDINAFESQFASYMYYTQKYESTPMNLTCSFKPDLLPGFPVLVLDRVMPMIGYLINVSHSIDLASGAAYTSMTLTHVRPAHEKVPLLTGWYDRDSFSPEGIGAHVYAPLGTRVYWESDDTPPSTAGGMVDNGGTVTQLVEKYREMRLQGEGYQDWKEGFYRNLPALEGGGILDQLQLTWDKDSAPEKLTGSGASPLTLGSIDSAFGVVDNERREAVEALSQTLSTIEGLWTPAAGGEG